MSLRFYFTPKETDAKGGSRPKYVQALGADGSWMDYGIEDAFFVGLNVTDEQHASLTLNSDVISIPPDIDSAIGLTALTTVQNKMEGMHIPAGWVTTSNTYRQVLAVVGRLFQFMGRFQAINLVTLFETGITLDTRINQLTQAQRNRLLNVAAQFNPGYQRDHGHNDNSAGAEDCGGSDATVLS
jgi:hypothetical protein